MEATKIAPGRAALSAAGLMVLAGVLVGYLTITQWYGVGTPTMALVALALILGPLGAVLSASEIAGLKPRDAALPVAVNIALGVGMAVAMGMPWRQAGVRAGLLSQGASLSAGRAAEFAMSDESDQVAGQACQWIYKHGDVVQRRVTTERVARQPKRAAACLAQGDDARIVAARTQLVRTWSQALFAPETSVDAVGALTAALGAVASDDVAATALLTCAVGHPDAAYRPLCADALASAQLTGERLAEVLARVDEAGLASVWQPRLIAYAHHQYGLTAEDKQAAVKLGMLMPGMRRLALVRGCEVLGSEGIEQQFRALATASCDVQGESIKKADTLWSSVCEDYAAALEKKTKKKDIEVFCGSLSDRLVEVAVIKAKSYVWAAIQLQTSHLMASSIHGGNRFNNKDQEVLLRKILKDKNLMESIMALPPAARAELMANLTAGGELPGTEVMGAFSQEQLDMAQQMVATTSPEGGMSKEDRERADEVIKQIESQREKIKSKEGEMLREIQTKMSGGGKGMSGEMRGMR